MSRNYYLRPKIDSRTLDKIKECVTEQCIYDGSLRTVLEDYNEIHLGKSSCGWQFCFDHNDWKYFEPAKQSIERFIHKTLSEGGSLVDEYGSPVSEQGFWEIVDEHKDGWNLQSFYDEQLKKWNEYLVNPEKFADHVLKPYEPKEWLIKNHPDIFSKDGHNLWFAHNTGFC